MIPIKVIKTHTINTTKAINNLLLDKKKIAVMPGESFGQAAAGHLRIAMTVSDKIFEQSLIDICELAENL